MFNIKLGLAAGIIAFGSLVHAQSFQIYIENGAILDAASNPVNFGGSADGATVNAFFGVTAGDTVFSIADPLAPTLEELSVFGSIAWTPLVDGAGAGVAWMTPAAPMGFESVAVGQKPLVAFMNVAGPGELTVGSQIVVGEGNIFLSNLDNRAMSVTNSNSFTAVVGKNGSLEMVAAVPEPSTYAAMIGLLALGLVMVRRRRK